MDYDHPYQDSYHYIRDPQNSIPMGLWTSQDGTQTFIGDLDDDHLINLIAMLRRRIKEQKGEARLLAKAWLWKMRVERMLRLEEER